MRLLLWTVLVLSLGIVAMPIACVEVAKSTGILVRKDCIKEPSREAKIKCGKTAPYSPHPKEKS